MNQKHNAQSAHTQSPMRCVSCGGLFDLPPGAALPDAPAGHTANYVCEKCTRIVEGNPRLEALLCFAIEIGITLHELARRAREGHAVMQTRETIAKEACSARRGV